MIRMKVGGMILTGCAAFLMVNKIVNSADSAVSKICETAKWRGYYRCWAKGKAEGEPVAPGYSVTTRPAGADYDVVKDPEGTDHSRDNAEASADTEKNTDSVKAVVDAVKAVAEKAIDTFMKPQEEPEEVSEGEIDPSEIVIPDDEDKTVEDAINDVFGENVVPFEYDETVKETDHETVD